MSFLFVWRSSRIHDLLESILCLNYRSLQNTKKSIILHLTLFCDVFSLFQFLFLVVNWMTSFPFTCNDYGTMPIPVVKQRFTFVSVQCFNLWVIVRSARNLNSNYTVQYNKLLFIYHLFFRGWSLTVIDNSLIVNAGTTNHFF